MSNLAKRATAALSIGLILHLTTVSPVLAQTSQPLRDAAARANDPIFKPDVSDLYSSDTGEVTIIGASPVDEDPVVGLSELFYGAEGLSAETNELPFTDDYEGLYVYRDEQLGNMATSQGAFTATGSLNAESAALEVLQGSQGLPSVANQSFLDYTREALLGTDLSGEFGQCVQVVSTGSEEVTYADYTNEYCETLSYDPTPMYAQRTYTGPGGLSYTTPSGVPHCSDGTTTVRVDGPATCSMLGALRQLPSAHIVRSCGVTGSTGCLEIVLDAADRPPTWTLQTTVQFKTAINVLDATINVSAMDETVGTLRINGNLVGTRNGGYDLNVIEGTGGSAANIEWYVGRGMEREPPTGYSPAGEWSFISYEDHNGNEGHWRTYQQLEWAGEVLATYSSRYGGSLDPDGSWTDPDTGWRYIRMAGACGEQTFTEGPYCTFPVYRFIDHPGGTGTLTVRATFAEQLFTPWVYSGPRWAEMQELVSGGLCTLAYDTQATATGGDGCVASTLSSGGSPGRLCGADIPVSPFNGLPDRGSTQISVRPYCSLVAAGQAVDDETFATTTTCGPLQEDASCTFTRRECVDELSNGACFTYEETYSCGQTLTYSSPTAATRNICMTNLACLGGECALSTGTDGSMDLADAAAKLSAVELMLADMSCAQDPNTAPDVKAALNSCELFKGEKMECGRVALGLSNCCKTPSGVSVADYLVLAFSISKLNATVNDLGWTNPVTSAWVSGETMVRNSFSELTRPMVEVWEGIVGNSEIAKTAAESLSLNTIKQTLMKSAAEWTGQTFGAQAANTIFSVNGGSAINVLGELAPGDIAFTGGAQTVLSAVSLAFTAWTIINVLSAVLFACDEEELELGTKRALKSAHEVGTYCSSRVFGVCLKRKTSYCTFASPLSRIMNEQIRRAQGRDFGDADDPDCDGITISDLQSVDMSAIDLSEWTGIMMSSGMLDLERVTNLDAMTGSTSTLGSALADLYPREDAITRNQNRLGTLNLDALREDAASDYGQAIVSP